MTILITWTLIAHAVLFALNLGFVLVCLRYSKQFESEEISFDRIEQRILWKYWPIVLSVVDLLSLISLILVDTRFMTAVLLTSMVVARPLVGVALSMYSSRQSDWMFYRGIQFAYEGFITMSVLIVMSYFILQVFSVLPAS